MPGLRSCKVLYFLGYFAVVASCLCLAQSPGKPSATATVEGTVAAKGLPDVTVWLEKVPTDPLSPFDGYLATVESDGRFHIENVAPGDYRLTAGSSSQMHGEFGSPAPGLPGAILKLKAGEDRKGLTLHLFPDPVGICGRVLDAHGKPLRADVEFYKPQFTADGTKLIPEMEQPVLLTNANGYFLLASYDIAGAVHAHQWLPRFFLRSNGVWYPSTENFADAIAVSPSAISQSGCHTIIRMPRTRCVGHRVIGKIQDMPAGVQSAYEISLFEVNPADVLFQKDSQPSIYSTDHLEFDNVCDGSYALLTWPDDVMPPDVHNLPNYFASGLFHVDGKDTDVTVSGMDQHEVWKLTNEQDIFPRRRAPKLPPAAPASIQGSLALVDGLTWKQACPSGISQRLRLGRGPWFKDGVEYDGVQPQYALLGKDGHFSFDKLESGGYTLNLPSFAHGAAYIKSFTVDGHEIPGTQFTLAAGQSAQLNVEISNDPKYAAGKPRAGNSEPHYLPPGTYPPASVAGRVAGPDSVGALVKLSAVRFNSAGSSLYQTVAAADGRFRFNSVQPGIYKLSTEGEHHQYSEYGAKGPGLAGLPVVLSAGQQQNGLDVKTYAKTSLCGRVIDPSGHALAGIDVSIYGYSYGPAGQTSWTRNTVTDRHGRYEFPEAGPGNFGLWAQEGDTRTWFPSNQQNKDRYAPWVELGPQVSGCPYDIYLRSPDGGSYKAHRVSGTVEGKLEPSMGDRFYVNLEPADKVFTPIVDRFALKDTHSFTLDGVWPGKYTLTVYGEYGKGTIPCPMPSCPPIRGYYHHLLASQQVTVDDRDVENIKVSIDTLPTLDGEVLIDGHRPEGKQWFAQVLTGPLTPGGRQKAALPGVDGHFDFGSLDAGEYGLNLPGFMAYENGEHYYTKSVLLNGRPIDGRHFQLKPGEAAHLTINDASDGASGTLRAGSDEPPVDPYRDDCAGLPTGGGITFLMIPDPLPADNSGIVQVYSYDTGATRQRDVSGVPPGKYHALAVENFSLFEGNMGLLVVGRPPGTAMFSSHADLVQLGVLGQLVEVKPNQQFDFTLPVVTAQMRRLTAEIGMPATH